MSIAFAKVTLSDDLFFKKNQQSITQSAMADRGSCFITTLNRTKQKGEEKKIEKKLKEK